VIIGIVLLVAGRPAAAQVNIEPFTLGREQVGWDAKIGANFKLEADETVLLEIDLSPRVDFSRGENSVTVAGNLGFSERAGTTFRSLYLLHTRYLREIDSTLSAEVFGRVQRDEFAKLSNRVSSGAGLRFEIAADEASATYAGFSLGFEREEWAVEPADRHPRTLSDPRTFGYLAYRIQITDNTTLLNTLSTSLRLNGDLQDGRIADTATMEVGISERVALQVTFGLEYDSRPPRSQPQVSMALTNGLTVTL
jgi:hypothetical protein